MNALQEMINNGNLIWDGNVIKIYEIDLGSTAFNMSPLRQEKRIGSFVVKEKITTKTQYILEDYNKKRYKIKTTEGPYEINDDYMYKFKILNEQSKKEAIS